MARTKKPFTWSVSRLDLFELCPFLYDERYNKGIQPERSAAADRGVDMHATLEDFLLTPKMKMLEEYKKTVFEKPLLQLRKDGASAEQKWAFDRSWKPTSWKGPKTWLRAITDTYTYLKGKLRVIDFKSGKIYDKHKGQGELYAACGEDFIKHELGIEPKIVTMEFWYLDKGIISPIASYTPKELARVRKGYENRVTMMEMARAFPPTRNWTCGWCRHSPRKGGKCKVG